MMYLCNNDAASVPRYDFVGGRCPDYRTGSQPGRSEQKRDFNDHLSHLKYYRDSDKLCNRFPSVYCRFPFGRFGNELEHHGIQFCANALGDLHITDCPVAADHESDFHGTGVLAVLGSNDTLIKPYQHDTVKAMECLFFQSVEVWSTSSMPELNLFVSFLALKLIIHKTKQPRQNAKNSGLNGIFPDRMHIPENKIYQQVNDSESHRRNNCSNKVVLHFHRH